MMCERMPMQMSRCTDDVKCGFAEMDGMRAGVPALLSKTEEWRAGTPKTSVWGFTLISKQHFR